MALLFNTNTMYLICFINYNKLFKGFKSLKAIYIDSNVRQSFCRQVKSYITKIIVIFFEEININTLLIIITFPIKKVELLPHEMYFIGISLEAITTLLLTEHFSRIKTSRSS